MFKKLVLLVVLFISWSGLKSQEEFVQEPDLYDWRPFGLLYNDADSPGELKLYQYYERRFYIELPKDKAYRGWYGQMVCQEKKQFDVKTYEESVYSRQYYPTLKSLKN